MTDKTPKELDGIIKCTSEMHGQLRGTTIAEMAEWIAKSLWFYCHEEPNCIVLAPVPLKKAIHVIGVGLSQALTAERKKTEEVSKGLAIYIEANTRLKAEIERLWKELASEKACFEAAHTDLLAERSLVKKLVGALEEAESYFDDRADCDYVCDPPTEKPNKEMVMREEIRVVLERVKKEMGDTCEDEGCPHYGTPHSHALAAKDERIKALEGALRKIRETASIPESEQANRNHLLSMIRGEAMLAINKTALEPKEKGEK